MPGAVGVLGNLATIMVGGDGAGVSNAGRRQAGGIVPDGQVDLVGHQPLIHQIQNQFFRHFPHHQPGLFIGVGGGQHLAGAEGAALRLIRLDVGNRGRLPAPGMVDEQLGVDAEGLVQQVLVVVFPRPAAGTQRNIAHRVQPQLLQPPLVAAAHPPEVGQRGVSPQRLAVGLLVQFGDAHPVFIGGNVLGHNVHRHLA